MLALADVRARCVDAEVGTVVFQDTAHVDSAQFVLEHRGQGLNLAEIGHQEDMVLVGLTPDGL